MGVKIVKRLICLIAVACALAASPSFADKTTLLKKPQPAYSVRTAQRMCLKAGEQCCCDWAGPLCCKGLQCVIKADRGFCE
jgi:hypothetical protein